MTYQEYVDKQWKTKFSKKTQRQLQNYYQQSKKRVHANKVNALIKLDPYIAKDFEKNYRQAVKNNGIFSFTYNDSLFIIGHGEQTSGNIAFGNRLLTPKEIADALEMGGAVPDSVKNIYTINCYGGQQGISKTQSGRTIASSHTSKRKITGNVHYDKKGNAYYDFSFDVNAKLNPELTQELMSNRKNAVTSIIDVDTVGNAIENYLSQPKPETPKPERRRDNRRSAHQRRQRQQQAEKERRRKQQNERRNEQRSSTNTVELKTSPVQPKPETPKSTLDSAPLPKDLPSVTPTKTSGRSLHQKSLSGGGKLAIGLAVAAVGVGVVASMAKDKKEERPRRKPQHTMPRTTNSEEIDNSYAQQMAADISSYRYGKHMTGFVNY